MFSRVVFSSLDMFTAFYAGHVVRKYSIVVAKVEVGFTTSALLDRNGFLVSIYVPSLTVRIVK